MTTLTIAQQQSFARYQALRDAARNSVQHALYPALVASERDYAALEAALLGDLAEWQPTHAASMDTVGPHVDALRAAIAQMRAALEQIAAADALVFPVISVRLAAVEEPDVAVPLAPTPVIP